MPKKKEPAPGEESRPAPRTGEALKWLMDQKGWTQSRMAQAMDVGQSQVSRWIKNDGEPSLRLMEQLCDEAGFDLANFLQIAGYKVDPKLPFREAVARLAAARIAAFQRGLSSALGLDNIAPELKRGMT